MSQNTINELTDRVSALTADVARLERSPNALRSRREGRVPGLMEQLYTYVPVMDGEGRRAFEVITNDGRGTGIIRGSAQSANGCAQTLNYNAQRLIKRRARAEAR